jgi:hypothetical protein
MLWEKDLMRPRSRMGLWRKGTAAVALLVLAALRANGQTGAESAVGYIDSAIPTNELRLRFDSAFGSDRPNRAEFIYAKPAGLGGPGLPKPETGIDFQDISAYLETLFTQQISGFVEVPVRFLEPEVNDRATGLADMNLGAKMAFLADDDQVASFQLRVYVPTGDAHLGLGNNHVSLEPALLLYERLTDRLALEAEFRDWIPVGGTDFAGSILRYGAGVSYRALDACHWHASPVLELVGWTVLDGKEAVPTSPTTTVVESAGGDTIVNAKMGVRIAFGEDGSGKMPRGDVYVGYGRALTGDVWYRDIIRVEFRLRY